MPTDNGIVSSYNKKSNITALNITLDFKPLAYIRLPGQKPKNRIEFFTLIRS